MFKILFCLFFNTIINVDPILKFLRLKNGGEDYFHWLLHIIMAMEVPLLWSRYVNLEKDCKVKAELSNPRCLIIVQTREVDHQISEVMCLDLIVDK